MFQLSVSSPPLSATDLSWHSPGALPSRTTGPIHPSETGHCKLERRSCYEDSHFHSGDIKHPKRLNCASQFAFLNRWLHLAVCVFFWHVVETKLSSDVVAFALTKLTFQYTAFLWTWKGGLGSHCWIHYLLMAGCG